jgi:hypothetical protein
MNTVSPPSPRKGWPFTKPAKPIHESLTVHPPFGQPKYAHLVVPVVLDYTISLKRSFRNVKKEIDSVRLQIQLERIAAEEFLKKLVPHLEDRHNPHDQLILNQLFVRFSNYHVICTQHVERVGELMHQERRLCYEHKQTCTPTVHVWSSPPRDLRDLEELQAKLHQANVAIANRLMWLAKRGGTNPRWHRSGRHRYTDDSNSMLISGVEETTENTSEIVGENL